MPVSRLALTDFRSYSSALIEPGDARAWTEGAGGHFIEMKGGNHFFWGKYDALAGAVAAFLEDALYL